MQYRDTRTSCETPAKIEVSGRWIDVLVNDVSAFGIRLSTPVPLEKGAMVPLSVKGIPIRARVVWSHRGRAGLRVPAGLSPATVKRIRGAGYQRIPPHWKMQELG